MAQASIHFEPVKGGSEEHNKRLKLLDYVRPFRTHLNEYWESDTQANRLAAITQNFLEHHPKRKKLHAKATPIREAVVNITESTTMEDLKKLAKRLRDRFGIEVFQIAIHKDEGYFNSPDGEKLNLHAHLVADWTNHELGESLKLSRQDMAEMQTINAECLNMQRGVSSDKKHLTAMQYKEQKAREEAEKAEQKKAAAKQETFEATILLNHKRREIDSLQEKKEKTVKEVEKMRSTLSFERGRVDYRQKQLEGLKSEISSLQGLKDSLNDDIDEKISQLNEKQSEVEKAIKAKQEAEQSKDNIAAEAQSYADVVQSARSDIHELEARKTDLQKEVLSITQERARLQRELATTPRSQSLVEAQKAGNIWRDMIYAIWTEAKAAVNVLCRYLSLKHINVTFDRDEVIAINNAMKSAQSIAERKDYGRDLVKLAHAEYPGYSDDATRLWEISRKVEEVADYSNRWFQSRSQDQSQSRGY